MVGSILSRLSRHGEKPRPREADGIEAVAIVTPNHMHAPVADAFLEVVFTSSATSRSTTTLEEAAPLWRQGTRADEYSPSPIIIPAIQVFATPRAMVQGGELGAIRIVQVEYPQDWLADPLEASGQKQADWRTDPGARGRRRLRRRHRHPCLPAGALRPPE